MPNISLRKRSNGWEYYFTTEYINGKQKRMSKGGFKTKKEAENAGLAAHTAYEASMVQQACEMTYSEYLDFWIESYCKVNLKTTTLTGYIKRIDQHIKPSLGQYSLADLTPLMLQTLLNDMFMQGYSRNTLNSIKGLLSSSLSYAVTTAQIISSSPAVALRLPNKRAKPETPTRTKVRQALTREQWNSILARFPEGHSCHIPLQLGYHLGLRLGEAFALIWEDVDFERQTISVNRQVQWDEDNKCWYFTEPKYESYRTIHVDSVLMELLKSEFQKQKRAKEYLEKRYAQLCINERDQLSSEGTPIHLVTVREDGSYIQPRVTQHLNFIVHTQLEMPLFDYHTLRHTHTTMLMEAGVNPLDAQERLGHSKLATTWRYAHNTVTIKEQTKSLLNKIYVDEKY